MARFCLGFCPRFTHVPIIGSGLALLLLFPPGEVVRQDLQGGGTAPLMEQTP